MTKIEWTETQIFESTYCTATAGDCVLSITGDGSAWAWEVQQQHAHFRGLTKSLADAKRTSEAVALRVQGGAA